MNACLRRREGFIYLCDFYLYIPRFFSYCLCLWNFALALNPLLMHTIQMAVFVPFSFHLHSPPPPSLSNCHLILLYCLLPVYWKHMTAIAITMRHHQACKQQQQQQQLNTLMHCNRLRHTHIYILNQDLITKKCYIISIQRREEKRNGATVTQRVCACIFFPVHILFRLQCTHLWCSLIHVFATIIDSCQHFSSIISCVYRCLCAKTKIGWYW